MSQPAPSERHKFELRFTVVRIELDAGDCGYYAEALRLAVESTDDPFASIVGMAIDRDNLYYTIQHYQRLPQGDSDHALPDNHPFDRDTTEQHGLFQHDDESGRAK